jgi:Fic family protein
MISAHFSRSAHIFLGRRLPEEGHVVGYTSIVDKLNFRIPTPDQFSLVCNRNKKYETNEWVVFPDKYLPDDNLEITEIDALYRQLVFALKYEGINLLLFSQLVRHYSEQELAELVSIEPEGQYSRRIWFLIEWLLGKELTDKEKLTKRSYIPLVDEKLQYAIAGEKSSRQMVINNLPGSINFCPLIRKTDKLESLISEKYAKQKGDYLESLHKDILQRASAFLLLKDSKASFTIEGESPKSKRAARWGQAIGQAGTKELSKEEILRLQQIVIENDRFIEMGLRIKGGFIGGHDRITGEPIPDHISARWEDLDRLIDGWIETDKKISESDLDPVLAATLIAFGFVFIHPFVDGNGRIHRYLIHHVLAKMRFSQQGMIFPVSASILNHIDDYRVILESYSRPLLNFIDWEETSDHNIRVLNETIDYYRYCDLTRQAEFLYDCVKDTIENVIPTEITYLTRYDEFKRLIDDEYEMPDSKVALLVRFLEQNNGKLSKNKRDKEFEALKDAEVAKIEYTFEEIFLADI